MPPNNTNKQSSTEFQYRGIGLCFVAQFGGIGRSFLAGEMAIVQQQLVEATKYSKLNAENVWFRGKSKCYMGRKTYT